MNDHSATSPMQGVTYMKAPERDSIGDNASVADAGLGNHR